MAPEVRVPQQQRSIETRKRILAAARDLFSTKGFHGTNSKEIAAQAGVSIGSFYSYFTNKKVLFMEVFMAYEHERVMQILRGQSRQDFERQGGRAVVGGIIRSILQAHDMSPEFKREAMAMCYSDPEVEGFHAEIERQIYDQLVAFFSQFQDSLRVTDIEAAAVVVSNAVEIVVHHIKLFNTSVSDDRLIEALTDMIYRFLFNDGECPPACGAQVLG